MSVRHLPRKIPCQGPRPKDGEPGAGPANRKLALRRLRGFTLIELAVVVVMIGILAGMVMPVFTSVQRDRRANQFAQGLSMFYRLAKARATGRGAPQMIRYTASGPGGAPMWTMHEAISAGAVGGGVCDDSPLQTSCNGIVWQPSLVTTGSTKFVASFPDSVSPYVALEMQDPTEAVISGTYDVCFTSGGQTFARSGNAAFAPLAGIPRARVYRTEGGQSGVNKWVIIPPNGLARVQL